MDSDRKPLTDAQRQALVKIIYPALLQIRLLGWAGNSEQAADLADAFHNLPVDIWQDHFDILRFRNVFLASYQRKYSGGADYMAMVDEVIAMQN